MYGVPGVPGVLACCLVDVPVPSCLRRFYGATPMCMILARASAVPGVWYPVECRSHNSDHTPASWQERTSLTSRLPHATLQQVLKVPLQEYIIAKPRIGHDGVNESTNFRLLPTARRYLSMCACAPPDAASENSSGHS